MSHNKTQRQNISTKTALNASQLIDRSINNGAKIINHPPENPLFGRSDKLVRDLFETKEPVYKFFILAATKRLIRTPYLRTYQANIRQSISLHRRKILPTSHPKFDIIK